MQNDSEGGPSVGLTLRIPLKIRSSSPWEFPGWNITGSMSQRQPGEQAQCVPVGGCCILPGV